LLFLVSEDWYFCSHRLPIARAARDAGWRVVVATRVREHGAHIEAEGFELRPIGMRRRGVAPWRECAAVLELVRLYRRERPAICHHVAIKPVLYGTLAALLAGVPRVVNAIAGLGFVFSSDSVHARVLRWPVRLAYRMLLRPARVQVIVQNAHDARAVAALQVARERIVTIPGSGVDLVRFAPSEEPTGPVVVAMVSRMLADKGVVELVEAARQVKAALPQVQVLLIGPPDPDNPASVPEAQLRAWSGQGVVRWCPGTDDVPAVWARSHIAVLPSYREGLPKSLLEAAACGRAIIASDVPGCSDVVVHGETGLLVPPRDAAALARAIARLAGDPALRRRLGDAARARVERLFAEPQVIAQTLALYGPVPTS
jgi:glycosyltransferase involved in cell wall biosynthesis